MKKYLDMIIANGRQEDMDCLGEMLVKLINDSGDYKKYRNKIIGMAYNYTIPEEMAEEIVYDMKPNGEVWNMETIRSVTIGNPHRVEDMYVVMNSLANDYSSVIPVEDAEKYIQMANLWIDDIDGREHKIWWYFVK